MVMSVMINSNEINSSANDSIHGPLDLEDANGVTKGHKKDVKTRQLWDNVIEEQRTIHNIFENMGGLSNQCDSARVRFGHLHK